MARRIFYLLQHEGPLVAACGAFMCSMQTLSCTTWDQVLGPGIKHRPPKSQPLNHQESPPLQYSLPGKFHGQRSPVGYSPWGCKEMDMTEYVHTCSHTHMCTHLGLDSSSASHWPGDPEQFSKPSQCLIFPT